MHFISVCTNIQKVIESIPRLPFVLFHCKGGNKGGVSEAVPKDVGATVVLADR